MASALQSSFGAFKKVDASSLLARRNDDEDVEMTSPDTLSKLIIAFDFGTTFSSVAYARVLESTRDVEIRLSDVTCVARYPGDRPIGGGNVAWDPRQDVPTQLWYSHEPSQLRSRMDTSGTRVPGPGSGADNAIDVHSDSDSDLTLSSSDDEGPAAPAPATFPTRVGQGHRPYWGFEVQRQLQRVDIPRDNQRRIARFKLMLDTDNAKTKNVRQDLSQTLRALKRSRHIARDTDVITEYLLQLFLHTKAELRHMSHFTDQTPVEFVLCVPAVWPVRACRTMQSAMVTAAQRSGLQSPGSSGLSNLFIISEPEAAAACVLAENQNDIFPGETIVILDAGGGTVDAITYEVTSSYPLRLHSEAVEPGTALCGASYINERFEKLLLEKLKDETYLVRNQMTLKSIVDDKVIEFENNEKRTLDVTARNCEMTPIFIHDLQPKPEKGLHRNNVHLSRDEVQELYWDSLKEAEKVLKKQLHRAKEQEISVEKIILIGGFGHSPSLQRHLRRRVAAKELNYAGRAIEFLVPQIPSTAVARGAVLRASNKEKGPVRITCCSYGFLRREPFEPECPEHQGVRCNIDKVDGERYVNDTIDWLIKRGASLKTREEVSIRVKHTFSPTTTKLICREELYVSDGLHNSHYKKSHKFNQGAEFAGAIEADMTYLRDDGHIQLFEPSEFNTRPGVKSYWAVEFDLVMIIEGRNLYYEARWPQAPEDGTSPPQQQEVRARGQVCIAAAFKPGTA